MSCRSWGAATWPRRKLTASRWDAVLAQAEGLHYNAATKLWKLCAEQQTGSSIDALPRDVQPRPPGSPALGGHRGPKG